MHYTNLNSVEAQLGPCFVPSPKIRLSHEMLADRERLIHLHGGPALTSTPS